MGSGLSIHEQQTLLMNRIAVYCGSASPRDHRFIEVAKEVGKVLANRGIGIVYGGGKLGLMGALAKAGLACGGEVIGVIPESLSRSEITNHECSKLYTVDSMHERKQLFTELSDGFIAIPGGVGTMDELWEALSWAQLGYHSKPVGLLNAMGFFDHLLAFKKKMEETGFIRQVHHSILNHSDDLNDLIDQMLAYKPHTPILSMLNDNPL